MSLTLSPPVRVFALVGAIAATGLLAVVFLLGRSQAEPQPVASETVIRQTSPTTQAAAAQPKAAQPKAAARQQAAPASGLPPVIGRALRRHGVVVVALYMPGAPVDALVRAEARAGAKQARVGFVAVSALSERLAGPLVAKAGVLPDPAVLVITRPSVVTATFGVTDRGTVAETALRAKR